MRRGSRLRAPGLGPGAVRLASGIAALAAAGCEETVPARGCEPGDAPSVTLGKGLTAFAPMDEGGRELELIHGSQGGFHVDLAIEARHLDPSEAWTATLRGWLDGELRAESQPFLAMRCNQQQDALQVWGLRLVWDAQPEDLDGRAVDLDAGVVDAAGEEAGTREEGVTIDDPELP